MVVTNWLSVGHHLVISDEHVESRMWWVAGGSNHIFAAESPDECARAVTGVTPQSGLVITVLSIIFSLFFRISPSQLPRRFLASGHPVFLGQVHILKKFGPRVGKKKRTALWLTRRLSHFPREESHPEKALCLQEKPHTRGWLPSIPQANVYISFVQNFCRALPKASHLTHPWPGIINHHLALLPQEFDCCPPAFSEVLAKRLFIVHWVEQCLSGDIVHSHPSSFSVFPVVSRFITGVFLLSIRPMQEFSVGAVSFWCSVVRC